MICTETSSISTKSISIAKTHLNRQQKLISKWKKVNGSLVCQWIRA